MKDSWRIKKVSELVEIRVSNVDKVIFPEERKVRLCNYMDAYNNNYLSNDTQYSIGSVNSNEYTRFSLLYDDVIITKDSETPEDIAVSSVVVEDLEDVICGYHLAILRPVKNEVFGQFLMHKLQHPSIQKLFYRIASGSTRYGLTISGIENVCLSVPPLPQQRKIAKILSTCDSVIENTEAAISKYHAIKQGMMHDLFIRGVDLNTRKVRPLYKDAPELYKESALGLIPKEWEVNKFEDYFKFISYGFTNPMPELEEGPFMVTAANVKNGCIDYSTARKTSQKLFDAILTDKSKPQIGDLLLTKDGTLGRVAIVDKSNICINQSVAVVRFKDGVDPEFFKILLETPIYQKKMLDDAGGSTIKHIYITVVNKMLLAVPTDSDERKLITEKIRELNNILQTEQLTLVKYKNLKAGLMQDLLTGKVEVVTDELQTI